MKSTIEFERNLKIAVASDISVLITGPTGAGKSLLAKKIHEQGVRKGKPFVAINLATLHEATLESELFGYEKGAFTGAESRRIGRLESGNGGTVFLDEIGDLSLGLQSRLLEFLQSKSLIPMGGNREVKLDVRIIAATHRDLESLVQQGKFREDLFHRLRVLGLEVPGLCERSDEFDTILHAVLGELSYLHRRAILRITEKVASILENYSWPGNVRELRNVLEYAVLSSGNGIIDESDPPIWFLKSVEKVVGPKFTGNEASMGVAHIPMTRNFEETLALFERHYLERALDCFDGKISETARQIGVSKTTLLRRIREFQLSL